MRTIWKFAVEETMQLLLPVDAMVLSIQTQFNAPQMWILLDSDLPKTLRRFIVLPTGVSVPDVPLNYCGTFQINDGALIFHVFEAIG
jgi:hypothetical protein